MPASTGTWTTEFLGLHPSGVRNKQCSVVRNKLLLQLHSTVRIEVLCVVCNQGLGDSLSDSVDLGCVSTALDTDTDIDGGEGIFASYEDGLVHLETEDLRLDEVDGGAIDTDEATALLSVGDSGGSLADDD